MNWFYMIILIFGGFDMQVERNSRTFYKKYDQCYGLIEKIMNRVIKLQPRRCCKLYNKLI